MIFFWKKIFYAVKFYSITTWSETRLTQFCVVAFLNIDQN